MKKLRTDCVVLRRINYGEADRILKLLTPSGSFSVMARGVRKEKSRLAGGIELFAKDEAKFLEREKNPKREFVGPEDYGRVTFDYPKTWSVYINKDASNGGTFEVYLNPITVPTVSATQQFAARVTIEQKDYDKAITSYDGLVKKGSLKASSVTADGNNGTRLDGSFTKDIRGSAVIFKIRDKTLTIRTDAETFTSDFNNLITTIKFNQ